MTNINELSDAVEVEAEQQPAVIRNQSEFMQAYKEIAAALPEALQDKLLNMEACLNNAFILGCSFAYKKGLMDAARLGGSLPAILDPR